MTKKVKVDDESNDDIDLIHALKTAFSDDGDPEMFLARAADQIREVETLIIDTCSRNRIRIDDNLYALLEARDAISEQTGQLDKSTRTASEITTAVDDALSSLTAKLQVRKNLDAALAVAAQTRRLTRMYARIEDTVDSRRLYTALRMLQLLEAETAAVQPHTILHELVPDARRLRAHISQHALRGTKGWHVAVRRFERPLGRYALRHAAAQAASDRVLFDSPRGALRESVALLSAGPTPPSLPRRRSAARPFTPLLAQSAEPEHTRRGGVRRSGSTTEMVEADAMVSGGGGAIRDRHGGNGASGGGGGNGGGEAMRNPGGGVDDEIEDVPKVYLRPLLQGVLVGEGLHLLGDIKSEYRRERLGHLRRILDGVEEDEELDEEEEQSRRRNKKNKNKRYEGTEEGSVAMDERESMFMNSSRRGTDVNANEAEHARKQKEGNEDKSNMDGRNRSTSNINDGDGNGRRGALDEEEEEDDDIDDDDDDEGVDGGRGAELSRASELEKLVWDVTGFFVVERAVETHASHTVVAREVVDGEWWAVAYGRLSAVLKQQEESAVETESDKAMARRLHDDFERFALVNALIR